MLELYIRNKQLEIIDIIDNYSSVIWTKRYNECGDFEIYIRATPQLLKTLQPSYYVTRNDDDMVGIIEKITLTTDTENGDYITVSGRDVLSLLTRRVFIKTNYFNDMTVENTIRAMISQNCIDPEIPLRKINEISLADVHGYDTEMTINMQVTGSNLYDEVVELAKRMNYGLKMTLINNKFVFDIYKFTDRSFNQSENPYVVFSEEYSNLLNTSYSYDVTNFKNVAVVAGQGEGENRVWETTGTLTYTDNWKYIDRYEMFVDSRDTESTYREGKIIGASMSNYWELAERGQSELMTVAPLETFEGDIDTRRTYKYKSDYFVGDVVQICNEYGLTATTQIIEIIENEDENGYTVVPTFST